MNTTPRTTSPVPLATTIRVRWGRCVVQYTLYVFSLNNMYS